MAPSEKIQADQPVEDLVESHPALVGFLVHQGLPCVVCGEPFWGTLADLARSKGWTEPRIDAMVREFNENH
jgi:hypothetical protein